MSLSTLYNGLDHSSSEALRDSIIKVLAKASLGEIDKLLDLGCGMGEFSLRLTKVFKVGEVYGVDVSDNAVEVCRTRGIKGYKVDLNFERLPFPSNFFDLALAVELIEHLLNPDNMLTEAYRVLQPSGLLLLSTPNLASWINRALILMGYMPYFSEPSLRYNAGMLTRNKIIMSGAASGHLRLYTLKAVKELLRFYGFKIAKVYGSHAGYNNRILSIIDKVLSIVPSLASDVIVLAKKEIE